VVIKKKKDSFQPYSVKFYSEPIHSALIVLSINGKKDERLYKKLLKEYHADDTCKKCPYMKIYKRQMKINN